jgi:hypothetical protein
VHRPRWSVTLGQRTRLRSISVPRNESKHGHVGIQDIYSTGDARIRLFWPGGMNLCDLEIDQPPRLRYIFAPRNESMHDHVGIQDIHSTGDTRLRLFWTSGMNLCDLEIDHAEVE